MKTQHHSPRAFADLGVEPALLDGLRKVEFHTPTDIQKEMIPILLAGRDVLGQARTGTGKTAAFALPILQRLSEHKNLQAIILVPTRELAVQVTAEIRRLAEFTPFKIVPIYGGQSIKHQLKLMGRQTHVITATPGRILDMLGRKLLDLTEVAHVVLDEVDRMLDIGFIDDIRRFLKQVPSPHQTTFVSATISEDVKRLTRQFMNDPQEVNVSRDELTVESVEQFYCTADPWDKYSLLWAMLKHEQPKLAIVFTNTKHAARKLAKKLHQDGVNVKEIHGDLVQQKRERVMTHFRRHQIDVLVATDLASRGIDGHSITHIINYDLPEDPQVYVHRIGRTARMGAFGRAITIATREQGPQLTHIEMLINKEIRQIHYDGFTPRPEPDRARPSAPRTESRLKTAVFTPAQSAEPKTAPPKTLGGKFKPARRRR